MAQSDRQKSHFLPSLRRQMVVVFALESCKDELSYMLKKVAGQFKSEIQNDMWTLSVP